MVQALSRSPERIGFGLTELGCREVGIIGNEFWNVWESRNEVLLVTRVRRALHKWGYAAKDVKILFQYVAIRLNRSGISIRQH